MSDPIASPPYGVTLDSVGNVAGIHLVAEDRPIPIDPTSPEYCSFVTWAANQQTPLGFSFDRLERDGIYFGQQEDLIAYCKEKAIVLFCHDRLTAGIWDFEVGQANQPKHLFQVGPLPTIQIVHATGTVANEYQHSDVAFFRLYQTSPSKVGNSVDGGDGQFGIPLPVFVTHTLLKTMRDSVLNEDSDIRRLSSWPVEKTFVYVDVSGFSQHPVGQQLLVINKLIQTVGDQRWWSHRQALEARDDLESNLCIGDGYIFVFRNPWAGVYFAGYFAALIEAFIARSMFMEFHFRMSVHSGPVYRFWDKWGPGKHEGRWNYVGRGITDGQRVLSAIGKDRDDIVFVSSATRQHILAGESYHVLEIREALYNRGRQADKHNEFRRVYELDHTKLMVDVIDKMIAEWTMQAKIGGDSGPLSSRLQ